MNFKGKAKRIEDIDLPRIGAKIGVGEDEIHAVMDVETRGSGFDSQGRPRILFERHKFYKYLPASKKAAGVKSGLANKRPGGYGKESAQYGKLVRAMAIDKTAALKSASWGLGQIMGFNHEAAGYATVDAMVKAFMDDEDNHLEAMINFIKFNHLDDELRDHEWAAFARGYNGPGYRRNDYHTKLTTAYAKWSKIRDTPYPPQKPITVTEVLAPQRRQIPDTIITNELPDPPPQGGKGKLVAVFVAIVATSLALIYSSIVEIWNAAIAMIGM